MSASQRNQSSARPSSDCDRAAAAGRRDATRASASPWVAFRVDANARIGVGHLTRCLTLADAVARHGARARFVSHGLQEHLSTLIATRGHELAILAGESSVETEDTDASATARALADRGWRWIVVDHYALGARWEGGLGDVGRILAIDDLANRPHACDALLDQNYLEEGERRYYGKVPPGCELLVGPRYALLRPEYREYRERVPRRNATPRRVFVFFGGSDPFNLNALALEALSDQRLRHLEADVVCGDASTATELGRNARPGIHVHGPRPHLADLMAAADVAIGAGGSTTWERLCLGLRSLVVTVADNQVHVARWLEHEGLIRLVGDGETVTAADLRDALLHEIAVPRMDAIEQGMRLCDGEGARRVADVMWTTR